MSPARPGLQTMNAMTRPACFGDEQPAVAEVERIELADEELQLAAVERGGDVVAGDFVELRGEPSR